jgi:hypothetical protein
MPTPSIATTNEGRPIEAIPLFREANRLREALAAEVARGPDELRIQLGWAQGLHWLGVAPDQIGANFSRSEPSCDDRR